MNFTFISVLVFGIIFLLQCFFFIFALRILAQSKYKRDKEYALLDAERHKIFEMQNSVKNEVAEAKKLSADVLNKCHILGSEAHSEWENIHHKIHTVLHNVEDRSKTLLSQHLSDLECQRLALEKSSRIANQVLTRLHEQSEQSKQLLQLFDHSVPVERVLQEVATEKYEKARNMLQTGVDASVIAKKLGISMSEVILLARVGHSL